jgi:hypothetical protein
MDVPDFNRRQFEQICRALSIGTRDDDYNLACEVWERTITAVRASGLNPETPEISARMEEALVQWILARWQVAALPKASLYQSREAGGARGTDVVHPGVESLSRTYERHRYVMDELVGNRPRGSAPITGLAKEAMEIREGTHGIIEEIIGAEPGKTSPFSPRMVAGEDREVPEVS